MCVNMLRNYGYLCISRVIQKTLTVYTNIASRSDFTDAAAADGNDVLKSN